MKSGTHLDRGLRQVVRVAQLGGDVEAEVGGVFDGGVSQADAHGAALFEGLFEQQRLQDGIQLLAHVLQQHCKTKAQLEGLLLLPLLMKQLL